MADDFGFQPTVAPKEDFGFQPMPKMPDTSGVQKMAQDNLSKPQEGEGEPQVTTSHQRLDTAMGMPVSTVLKGGDAPIPAAVRGQLVNSYANGSASNVGDFMQSALHSVLPMVVSGVQRTLHPVDTAENFGNEVGQGYATATKGNAASMAYPFLPKQQQQDLIQSGAVESEGSAPVKNGADLIEAGIKGERTTLGKAMGGLYAPVASLLGPFINPAIEGTVPAAEKAGVPSPYAKTIPGMIGVVMDVLGMAGAAHMGTEAANLKRTGPQFTPGEGPWDNHSGSEIMRDIVNKDNPNAVSSPDIDNHIAESFKDKAPAAQDFHDVAAAMAGVGEVSTLHVIYKETGVKPDQVFEDARNDPQVASDVAAGKVPEAYEHLVEPKPELPPEKAEKLQVTRSDTAKAFNVVDETGEHVQSGFESYEDAKRFVEDKKEEPIGDEPPEWKEKPQDVFTKESAEVKPKPVEPLYTGISEKVAGMNPEERALRLDSLNKKMEAAIITPKEMAEREALSAKLAEPAKPEQILTPKSIAIPPSKTGKPTSLRSFLSNNGAKFNEANELISIKRGTERLTGAGALEHANEIAKEHGYLGVRQMLIVLLWLLKRGKLS